jgi:hypothetical protein
MRVIVFLAGLECIGAAANEKTSAGPAGNSWTISMFNLQNTSLVRRSEEVHGPISAAKLEALPPKSAS